MIRAGDILLTGRPNFASRALQWRLNGRYSHCIPMITATHGLNAIWPRGAKIEDVMHYLDGTYRFLHLRPRGVDLSRYLDMANWLDGTPYDALSYLGFIGNKQIQDAGKINCAEATLSCLQAGGLLQGRTLDRISPQSFFEMSCTDAFEVITTVRP